MLEKILGIVKESYQRIGAPKRIGVAVSGGADSIALLYLLNLLRQEMNFDLLCIHVNHGLRKEAQDEQAYVISFCRQLDVYCECKCVDLDKTGNIEDAARRARYACFERFLKRHDIECIAVAHHLQDQAETMLMHLFYGSGMQGLLGMREYNHKYWRPLLPISKENIISALHESNISYCIDQSNFDTSFTRNALRVRVLPEIEKIYPHACASMYRNSQILLEEHSFLESICDAWLAENFCSNEFIAFFNRKQFITQKVALQRRILQRVFSIEYITFSYESIEGLRKTILGRISQKCNLPQDAYAIIHIEKVYLFRSNKFKTYQMGKLKQMAGFDHLGDGIFCQSFDLDRTKGAILRTRKPGDRFSLLNTGSTQSLKEYMINKKIPQLFRDAWPIYAVGSEVLWVIGHGVSNFAAIRSTSKNIAPFVYVGSLPDGRINSSEDTK